MVNHYLTLVWTFILLQGVNYSGSLPQDNAMNVLVVL